MLWIFGTMLLASVAVRVRQRRCDFVFVSPMDPISVLYLRFASRTPAMKAALYDASSLLQ